MSDVRIETVDVVASQPAAAGVGRVIEQSVTVTRREDFVSSLSQSVRENPTSAALIGMGLAWLLVGGSRVSLRGGHPGARSFSSSATGSLSGAAERVTSTARSAISRGRQTASRAGSAANEGASEASSLVEDAASRTSDAASAGYKKVSSAADRARVALSETLSGIGSSIGEASSAAYGEVRREAGAVQESLSEFFERQPLALAALGTAIGVGLAAALPRTQAEAELMGEKSDAMKRQARSLVSEGLATATTRAEEVIERIVVEAKEQGFSEERIALLVREFSDKLSDLASAAGNSMRQEIEKEKHGSKPAMRKLGSAGAGLPSGGASVFADAACN